MTSLLLHRLGIRKPLLTNKITEKCHLSVKNSTIQGCPQNPLDNNKNNKIFINPIFFQNGHKKWNESNVKKSPEKKNRLCD